MENTTQKHTTSDLCGRFHPISFMFLSHYTEQDFDHFFSSFIKLVDNYNLEISVEYLMQDADRACLNSAKKNFPLAKNLMCFFHVMYNVRKHKHLINDSDKYNDVKNDIRELHTTLSKIKFSRLKSKILNKWSSLGLVEFSNYFKKQWLDGEFSNWSIYHTPAGFASTNNPVESFNNIIKTFITLRFKANMLETLENFKYNLIDYDHREFRYFPNIKKICIERGRTLAKTGIDFLKTKKNCYEYTNFKNIKYTININIFNLNNPKETFCSCAQFHAKAFCKHVIMVCLQKDLKLQGLEKVKKFSIRSLHRSRKASKA